MTAAVELPTTVDPGALASERARGRVVEVAASLLASLDYSGAAGRLPADARVQVSRLRHAVKLATHRSAATPPAVPALELTRPTTAAEVAAVVGRWAASQLWARPDSGPVGWVYLLCFRDPATGEHRPLCGNGPGGQYAGHYWGWTTDLVRRIEREHRNPAWKGKGRLVRVALAAGLTFELAWVEYPATPGREQRLKGRSAYPRCPLCRGTGAPLDAASVMAASLTAPGSTGSVGGGVGG